MSSDEILGEGGFGTVFIGRWVPKKVTVAVKMISGRIRKREVCFIIPYIIVSPSANNIQIKDIHSVHMIPNHLGYISCKDILHMRKPGVKLV